MAAELIIKLVTAPTAEPVTLAEAKSHMRVDLADDDTLIENFIKAARAEAEKRTGRALVTQTWDMYLPDFPATREIIIPLPPLQSVTHIKYTTDDDTTTTVSSTIYRVDTIAEPGRAVLKVDDDWPTPGSDLRSINPVELRFVCGYGAAAAVPERAKLAIKTLVAYWHANREAFVAAERGMVDAPAAFASLLDDLIIWDWRF